MTVYFNGDYASSRGFETSLIKSFSHKFSAEVNYTYSLATGVASDPNTALQFFNGGRLYLPISEQALDWDQRHTLSVQPMVRDPGKWGFRVPVDVRLGLPVHADLPQRPQVRTRRWTNSRRLPSAARLTIDGDKYYKVWGQNVTLFFDAKQRARTRRTSSNSTASTASTRTSTRRATTTRSTTRRRDGPAAPTCRTSTATTSWTGCRCKDPRVFEEGRSVRLGVSITF